MEKFVRRNDPLLPGHSLLQSSDLAPFLQIHFSSLQAWSFRQSHLGLQTGCLPSILHSCAHNFWTPYTYLQRKSEGTKKMFLFLTLSKMSSVKLFPGPPRTPCRHSCCSQDTPSPADGTGTCPPHISHFPGRALGKADHRLGRPGFLCIHSLAHHSGRGSRHPWCCT